MKDNQPTKKDLDLTIKLSEAILDYFHFKLVLMPNPLVIKGWAETQGQINDWEANEWRFQVINSDLGKTEVHQIDRFGWNILKMSKEIIYHAYMNLVGENASQDVIDHIYSNDNLWLTKLEELKKL